MNAAEQHRQWDASVEPHDDKVILRAGAGVTELTAQEAQNFAYYLANAYVRAGTVTRSAGGNLVIGRT